MDLDKNGIPILGKDYIARMKKGCNTRQCPPPAISTSSSRKERTGAVLGKYREIWPTVKF